MSGLRTAVLESGKKLQDKINLKTNSLLHTGGEVAEGVINEAVKLKDETVQKLKEIGEKGNRIIEAIQTIAQEVADNTAADLEVVKADIQHSVESFIEKPDKMGDAMELMTAIYQRIMFDPSFWQQIHEAAQVSSQRNSEMIQNGYSIMDARNNLLLIHLLHGGKIGPIGRALKETSDMLYKLKIADLKAGRAALDSVAEGSLFMATNLSRLAEKIRYKKRSKQVLSTTGA